MELRRRAKPGCKHGDPRRANGAIDFRTRRYGCPMDSLRRRWAAVRRHPVLAVVAIVLVALAIVFGILIGFLPGMAALAIFAVVVWWVVLEIAAWRLRRSGAPADTGREARTAVIAGVGVVVIGFGLMQAVPYGRDHTQPAVTGEPAWHDETTRTLMVRACFDCHSSEVKYPWYASVAPTSWAVQHHVDEARGAINYSQFQTDPGEAGETIAVILEGSMPPAYFTRFGLHPEADLTEAEKATLVAGLRKTPGMSEQGEGN